MRKGMILVVGGLLLLAGCKEDKSAGIPTEPKWKGEPYRIAYDMKAAKPSPAGVNIPPINFTANPDALVTRELLVLRVNASGATDKLLIGNAVDIKGADGTLSGDYLDRARKGLSEYLETNCIKGKVDVSVALARSSLIPTATVAQADDKRLSDWLPIEFVYKNPHSKCK
jgi:hypothetical protein